MTNYLEDGVTRILAMCEEAITGSTASDDAFWTQSTYPYWVVTMIEYSPAYNSQDFSVRPYQFNLEYILGQITENYDGERTSRIYTDEPTILTFFTKGKRKFLQSTAYPTAQNDISPEGISIRRSAGVGIYRRSGIGQAVFGTIFTLTVPYSIRIDEG